MSQTANTSLHGYHTQILRFMHRLQRFSRTFRPTPIPRLLRQVERATTPKQLTKVVNQVQHRVWLLSREEQIVWRERLMNALHTHVLHASQMPLRLAAAGWMRMLTQAGLVTHPQEVFVTFVTSAVLLSTDSVEAVAEQQAYLKLIFECFWAFRYPYPAFPWEMFPDVSVFYPLAPLLEKTDTDLQDALISIFAELPTLDNPEITNYLLPVVLAWSCDADPERRRRVAPVLAHISHPSAREALLRLQADSHPLVRASAKEAL